MQTELQVTIAICVTAGLLYLFEVLRSSPPKEVLTEFTKAREAAEKLTSPEIVAMLLKNYTIVEKVAIQQTRDLLKQYAQETDTEIDDRLCEWLNKKDTPL
jgi:flagellar basal body-associated protein FliL